MFYIQREPPKNDIEWNELQGRRSGCGFGNLMMMPGRARDQINGCATPLLAAGAARCGSPRPRTSTASSGHEQLVTSCTSCHMLPAQLRQASRASSRQVARRLQPSRHASDIHVGRVLWTRRIQKDPPYVSLV